MTALRRLAHPASPALLAALLLAAGPAAAQDAHYWTYGYGPIGQLTEGALVGGVSDLSAVYYNPGALALLKNPRFTMTLTSVELASVDVPDAAGQNLDFDQLVFDFVPAMLAGRIGSGDGDSRFGFALLSRHDLDWDLGYSDPRVSAATADGSAGLGRVRQRLVEYWGGVNWSRRSGESFSFGVTPFLAYRAQRSRRWLELEQQSEGASRALFTGRESEYNHIRVLTKAGLAWRPGPFELGLTLTTPGLRVWSNGKSVFNASIVGTAGAPVISASTQQGLESTFKSPWSVAGGATWRRRDTAVHTTLEWFSSIDPYSILTPEPAPIAGSPSTIDLTFTGAADDVLNFGAGVEHRLSERFALYGGLARNGSSWTPESETIARWDLTDVTGGFTIGTRRARIAFGASYAWGSEELPQSIVPPDFTGTTPTVKGHFSRWTLSVGATFDDR